MSIGERIRELRKDKHLTQTDLAKLINVSQQTITKWENNNAEPSGTAVKSLANVLSVSSDYILGIKEKSSIDLDDDDVIFTYEGRKIPKEDIELMRRLLRGSQK